VLGVAFVLAACGSGSEELTIEQQLQKLAGRTLTSTEVEQQLALADLMCGFDNRVLTQIWERLDARQLEFQDYVFGQHCPDRLAVYEEIRAETGYVPASVVEAARAARRGPVPGSVDTGIGASSDADSATALLEGVGSARTSPGPTTTSP